MTDKEIYNLLKINQLSNKQLKQIAKSKGVTYNGNRKETIKELLNIINCEKT